VHRKLASDLAAPCTSGANGDRLEERRPEEARTAVAPAEGVAAGARVVVAHGLMGAPEPCASGSVPEGHD
jgi:hypothetical protein